MEDLRMLDTEARFLDFALIGRHGRKRLLIDVENLAIGTVTYGVSHDLNAFSQRLLHDRIKLFGFVHEESLRVVVRIVLQQSGALRSKRAIHVELDASNRQAIAVQPGHWALI